MMQIKHTLTLTLDDSNRRVGFSVSRNELRVCVCVCARAFVRQIIFARNFYKN